MTGLLQNAYVFLSYRSFEREFAAKLASDLRNAGVGVWMDALDAGIEVGDDWPHRLEQAIDGCAGLICVLSPDYIESTYCRRELARADQRGVPLIPLLLKPLGESKSPIQLDGTQHLEFVHWKESTAYAQQYKRLDAELRRKLSPIFGSPPDREPQYLNELVAKLSRHMGVLEYTELATQVVDLRPRPWFEDEWGYSVLRGGGKHEVGEQREYASIAEIAKAQPRFALIGAPGAGKSTALRRLARGAALLRRERPRSSPLPLVLSLAEWSDAQDLQSFFAAHWPFESNVNEAIAAGDISLYLDGLNEMGEAGARRAAELRTWLISPGAAKMLVVTCRASEYEGELALDDLPTVLVKELEPQQIVAFAERYLHNKAEAFLLQLGIDRNGAGHHDRGLLALARNPYFLRGFIELFNHHESDLPRNTGKLLDRLTQMLWQRESARRTRGLVRLEELRARCARLARSMLDERKSLQVPLAYAERKTTHWSQFAWRASAARPLFHSAMSAGLMNVDSAGVRFSHQLVQEYFAALSFIDASQRARLDEVQRHRSAVGWRFEMSTFVALCGLTAQPEDLVRLALGWGAEHAGACLASGVVVSDQLQGEIVAALIAIVRQRTEGGHTEARAAENLGLIGTIGPEGITALGDLLLQDRYASRESAATALSRVGTKAAAFELHRALGKLGRSDDKAWYMADAADDYIVERLGEMGMVALPELIDTLGRVHPRFGWGEARASTVRALLRIGHPAVPALLEALTSGSVGAKAGGAEVLGQLRIVESVPRLLDAWATPKSGFSPLHNACRDAFKAIGDAAIPGVIVELGSALPARRVIGVAALGAIGTTTVVPHLLTALQDEEFSVSFEARLRLTDFGSSVVPALLELLDTAASNGVAAAASTLGAIKDARAVPRLTKLLSHSDAAVRSHAAFALGPIGDHSVTSELLPLLQDSDSDVALSAAASLGELKSAIAVNPLIRCLADRSDAKLRNQAALALEKIASPLALDAARRYWHDVLAENFHAFEAGDMLGRMKDAGAVPLLIRASREGPEFARSSYIKALATIGDRSAVPAIIERLHDCDPAGNDPLRIAAAAIVALGQLKDPQAVEPLLQMLSVTEQTRFDGRIGDLAAKGLQSIGTPEAVAGAGAHWQAALADPDLKIRLLAAEALATMRYEPATQELIAALLDQQATTYYDKRTVSDASAAALELIGGDAAHAALKDYWRSELGRERERGRVLAIIGLGRLQTYDAEAQLIARLEDTYTYEGRHVADYAADVLKTFPSQEARLAVARYVDRRAQR